jgi:hypothetical protein
MKRIFLFLTAALLTAALNVYAADSDFTVDANGVITKYAGFDTEVVIPATIGGKKITAIGAEAFLKADLISVTIPEGITSIGKSAFAENKLTTVTIPGSVKTIAFEAFKYNRTLTIINLSEGVEDIGIGAFGNTSCQSISIPASIKNMFNLFATTGRDRTPEPSSVSLAANINYYFGSTVPASVFYNYIANNRASGTYTADMTAIEKRADDHEYIETQYGAVLTRYTGSATRLRIPAEIGGVAVKAFDCQYGYSGLVAVQIPDSIVYIGGKFRSLERVDIPASVTYIGGDAFKSCKLTSVTIPENVAYIGSNAFGDCQLSSLTLPAKGALTTIDNNAFSNNKLTAIAIPASVTYIGNSAFSGNNLTSVTIPASVTYIGKSAFSKVKTITIPPTVKTLGGSPIDFYPRNSIVIGANVNVLTDDTSAFRRREQDFGDYYYSLGRKAGRYTVVWNNNKGMDEWTYSAK